MSSWLEILSPYTNRALSAMCAALDISEFANRVGPDNRNRAIERMRRDLGKPQSVRRALDRFGPAELAIVDALLRSNNQMPTTRLARILSQDSAVQLAQPNAEAMPDYRGIPSLNDAAARAFCYGIVFSRDVRHIDLNPGNLLYLPESVANTIRADKAWSDALTQRNKIELTPQFVETAPYSVSASAADFQRDLSRYLRQVRRQGSLSLTTTGWIYKTNFKAFLAALNMPADAPGDEASNPRLWFMRRLLTSMNELSMGKQGTLEPREESELLRLPMEKRIRLIYDLWSNSGAWNELNRISTDHQGYDYRREAQPELARARAVVLRLLTRLMTSAMTAQRTADSAAKTHWLERWVKVEQLVALIKRAEYQFLIPRRVSYLSYGGDMYSSPYYGPNNPYYMTFSNITDEDAGWDLVERQFIIKMLTEPLAWMGLVELGYAAPDAPEPLALRLTDTGAWLLGLAAAPSFVESGGRVLVQPNFTVIAMEPVSDAVLLALDEFGESQGGDRAVSYHLTRQSIYRGQQKGWSAARIRQFLEEHQGGAIPVNIGRTLDEWDAQHQRIVFHRAVKVLQYADEAARDGARHALQSTSLIFTSLAPLFDMVTHNTTAPEEQTDVSTALADAGWLPLLDGRNGEAESQLRISDSGEVMFKHAAPSILTLSQLQAFTEGDAARQRISARSVRAAMSAGMTLDQLLAMLAQLHDGPLPPAIEQSIRGWAGFYGKATLQTVHLLELSNAEVLDNLLDDAEVGAYLTPIEGSAKPIALVQAEQAERIRAILIERGVDVGE